MGLKSIRDRLKYCYESVLGGGGSVCNTPALVLFNNRCPANFRRPGYQDTRVKGHKIYILGRASTSWNISCIWQFKKNFYGLMISMNKIYFLRIIYYWSMQFSGQRYLPTSLTTRVQNPGPPCWKMRTSSSKLPSGLHVHACTWCKHVPHTHNK